MDKQMEVAKEYAQLIFENSNNVEEINKCRKTLGFDTSDNQNCTYQISDESTIVDNHIGIWHKEKADSKYYTRDKQYVDEYSYWCRNKEISDEKKGRRIILIGESVARGFLYDPSFTPAKYLEYLLNRYTEGKNYEVIDLARLGMKVEGLIQTIKQCQKLNPDLIIIFAGNNFRESIYLNGREKEEYLGSVKEKCQIEQINKIIEKKMDIFIAKLFKTIQSVKMKKNIPFLYIIPEFNLKDWESSDYEKEQYLITNCSSEWNKYFNQAERAFDSKDFETAKKNYKKLININQVYTYAYEKIAKIFEIEQNIKEARNWYEKARDSRYLNWSRASVCTSAIRDKIISYAYQCNCDILNLQEKFYEIQPDKIPGKDLFLDNCHMSSKGIMISMQLAADKISNLLEEKSINSIIRDDMNNPDRQTEARARFSAAIYNAHIGAQSQDSLYVDIFKAYKYDSDISKLMINYLNLASQKVPWVLNKDYEELLSDSFTIMAQMDECRILDIPLCNAMLKVLREEAGIDMTSEINALRIEKFGPHNEKINMLEPYYRENSYVKSVGETFYGRYTKKQLFARFTGPRTMFHLISRQTCSLKASIVARISQKNSQSVKVFLNNNHIANLLMTSSWSKHEFDIDKMYLREDGLNQLVLFWPEIYELDQTDYDIVMLNKCLYGEVVQFDIKEITA